MIVKKVDEYRSKYINNTETTVGVYELPGTKNERYITLKPKDEVIVKIKEKSVKEIIDKPKQIKESIDKPKQVKEKVGINTIDSNK